MATNRDRVLARGVQTNGSTWKVYASDSSPTVFADGIYRMQFSPAVTRLQFFAMDSFEDDIEDGSEKRSHALTLTMPTMSFLQFLAQTVPNLIAQADTLEPATRDVVETIKRLAQTFGHQDQQIQ